MLIWESSGGNKKFAVRLYSRLGRGLRYSFDISKLIMVSQVASPRLNSIKMMMSVFGPGCFHLVSLVPLED